MVVSTFGWHTLNSYSGSTMPQLESQRDYFAELYVAGYFGDAGWAVYFPKRDVGFDFVVSKEIAGSVLLRPVQVKGLYPTRDKGDKATYGFQGKLSAIHPEMVLVLPFFAAHERGVAPERIAFMPFPQVRPRQRGGYRCVPARFANGHALPRKSFEPFFGTSGIEALEGPGWSHGVPIL
jgi:hypothetical protein